MQPTKITNDGHGLYMISNRKSKKKIGQVHKRTARRWDACNTNGKLIGTESTRALAVELVASESWELTLNFSTNADGFTHASIGQINCTSVAISLRDQLHDLAILDDIGHYFVVNDSNWVSGNSISELLREIISYDIRSAIKHEAINSHNCNIFYVPLSTNIPYKIENYKPVVESLEFLGSVEYKSVIESNL